MKTIRIAISAGDPAGIGPEVAAKAIKSLGRIRDAVFFVVGDGAVLARYGLPAGPGVSLIDPGLLGAGDLHPGRPDRKSAAASIAYLERAVALVKSGVCDGLVTAPISKEQVRSQGFSWPGHTEYLQRQFHCRDVVMMFAGPHLKVGLVTRHLSLSEAIRRLTKKAIVDCGRTSWEFMRSSFGIKSPRIAVCGLNPHAGEGGLFGDEEIRRISPAVSLLNRRFGGSFTGPLPADTAFCPAKGRRRFDLVLAMYHDQGLAPFKALDFETGVQITAGLPIVRTSPVHGTAFDIAGSNVASSGSMAEAIRLCYELTKNRLKCLS